MRRFSATSGAASASVTLTMRSASRAAASRSSTLSVSAGPKNPRKTKAVPRRRSMKRSRKPASAGRSGRIGRSVNPLAATAAPWAA